MPDYHILFTGDAYGYQKAWDVTPGMSNGTIVRKYRMVHNRYITSMALSPDRQSLFTGDNLGDLKELISLMKALRKIMEKKSQGKSFFRPVGRF